MHFIQIVLILLSFATILFWLFELGGATFIQPFIPFFHFIKDVTHLFYTRTVQVDKVQIDFAFLIASLAFLMIVWILRYTVEGLDQLERKFDYWYEKIRKKSEHLFNARLEEEYVKEQNKINKFIVLAKFKAKNLTRDSFFERNVQVGSEEKEKEALQEFNEKTKKALGCNQKMLKEGLLLYFEDFNRIDKIISSLKDIINELKTDYSELNWQIKELMSIEPYTDDSEVVHKLRGLMLLNRLDFEGEITCLSTFLHRYALIKNPKYLVENKGIFEINKEEEVFCIKSL